MKTLFFLSFLIFLFPESLTQYYPYNFVIWNVGQGSWSTFIDERSCIHFDMGGEKLPIFEVSQICKQKLNWALITHDDWDHISGLKAFSQKVHHLCLYYPKKMRRPLIENRPRCPDLPSSVKIISQGTEGGDRNASSIIYLLENQILVTGDAPAKEEKKWAHSLPQSVHTLLLGHHGSRTSTSLTLIQSTKPQLAIASARKGKYGHPHKTVIERLKKQRVPMLSTETLGSIYMKIETRSFANKAYRPSQDRLRPLHK